VADAVRRGEGLDDNGNGTGGVADLDDYSRCKITRKEDFRDLYVRRYYFGCEADEVLPEAYELVEHGLLTEDDFRDFMFENAVRFWGEVNPDFFKGTVVEKQAAEVLAQPAARA
jgi:hypothetical protein